MVVVVVVGLGVGGGDPRGGIEGSVEGMVGWMDGWMDGWIRLFLWIWVGRTGCDSLRTSENFGFACSHRTSRLLLGDEMVDMDCASSLLRPLLAYIKLLNFRYDRERDTG